MNRTTSSLLLIIVFSVTVQVNSMGLFSKLAGFGIKHSNRIIDTLFLLPLYGFGAFELVSKTTDVTHIDQFLGEKKAQWSRQTYEKNFGALRPGNLQLRDDGTWRKKNRFDCATAQELALLYQDKLKAAKLTDLGVVAPEAEKILEESRQSIEKNNAQHVFYSPEDMEVLHLAKKYQVDTDAIRFKRSLEDTIRRTSEGYYKIRFDRVRWRNATTEYEKVWVLLHEYGHVQQGDQYYTEKQIPFYSMSKKMSLWWHGLPTKRLRHKKEMAADLAYLLNPDIENKAELAAAAACYFENPLSEAEAHSYVDKEYENMNHFYKKFLRLPEKWLPFKKEDISNRRWCTHPTRQKREQLQRHALYLLQKEEAEKKNANKKIYCY